MTQTDRVGAAPGSAPRWNLFLISVIILFLELACIRWFPAHVLYLAFFTNTVLLASFLGMSLGCLAASHPRNYLSWTPAVLLLAVLTTLVTELLTDHWATVLDVGHQASPQMIYFGGENLARDVSHFVLPIEVLVGFFFVLIAMIFVGPGQELGRALNRVPQHIHAYTLNILGSLTGIVLFSLCSRYQLPPALWFLAIAIALTYFLRFQRPLPVLILRCTLLALVAMATGVRTGTRTLGNETWEYLWSPYYRIDYQPARKNVAVNLMSHQFMVSRDAPYPAYALPYLLNRDAGQAAPKDVLIIGAGTGNDVSRALQWAERVDAVEIDPVIYELGRRDHPDRPYDDPRVAIHLDDGRNFLRTTDRQYDMIVYAQVDSLVLQSSYSSIRLESYLFTEEAFRDVRRHLKPGGVFVIYNFLRQGWVVARLHETLTSIFNAEPLVLALPFREHIQPEDALFGEFDMILVGDVEPIRAAFARQPRYQLPATGAPGPWSPNGFTASLPPRDGSSLSSDTGSAIEGPVWRFGLASLAYTPDSLRAATDNWPFLYLRQPAIPDLTLRGMGIMGGLALLLILFYLPKERAGFAGIGLDGRMFFLGAGFMLVETKAVVHMALLFGATWIVNSVVFFAILLMILAANLLVLWLKPQHLWPLYIGLFTALTLNLIVPLDVFLGLDGGLRAVGSSLLVFGPILFAGMIFALIFSGTASPNRAFGSNIAGAMFGGLTENVSMMLGFQLLLLVAITFYALTAALPRISVTLAGRQSGAPPRPTAATR